MVFDELDPHVAVQVFEKLIDRLGNVVVFDIEIASCVLQELDHWQQMSQAALCRWVKHE
ncbi:hypothetical protein E2C01_087893 [Portunus trituberculatus]|uniref:Uncharacterized protein n=1 Tax=Portunus trituberculatus TaxID=210409 RepID=A0A5B7JHR2_PORTR|nr:hypothetical protein [Portunus trituberculatus]